MKHRLLLFLTVVTSLVMTSSCSEEEAETTFYIEVPTFSTLGAGVIKMNAGDTRNIPVSVYSPGGSVTRFRVQEFYTGLNAFNTVIDLGSEEISMRYSPSNFKVDDFIYTAPSIAADSAEVKLRFYAENAVGESDVRIYSLRVYHKSDLHTASNVTLYPDATKRNGIYLNEADPSRGIQTTTVLGGETVDIFAVAPSDGSEDLPGALVTRSADFYFLPANTLNFDYASKANLQQVWAEAWTNPNNNPNSRIDRLSAGSVFVIGRGTNPIGIVKVIDTKDEDGTVNDYYSLSFRLI